MRGVAPAAWKALFAAQLGWMLDAMDFLLFTFALRAIQKEFDLSSGAMGLLTTVALLAGAVGGISFGWLADRIGRVRAMTISMLVYSAATAALATSTSVWQLVLWRTVVGIGMGGEWSCGSVLVAETWPAKYRARAVAIMQSGWAIGALIAAGLSALLLEPYGWRVLFLVGIAPAIVAFFIRRTVEEPQIWREQRPTRARSPFREVFGPVFLRRTLLASSLAATVLIAYWGVFTWLPSFLATPLEKGGAGLTLTKSASWMVAVQLGALAGYLSFGWIADRLGRRPAFTFFMIAAACVVPLYANVTTTAVLLLVGPLVGFFGSGYFSLFGAMLAELYPTRIRATAQGFCYNAGRVASAAAPFAIGVAADRYGLGSALGVTSLFFAIGGGLVWSLPETMGTQLDKIDS
jgi:MFS family permease